MSLQKKSIKHKSLKLNINYKEMNKIIVLRYMEISDIYIYIIYGFQY